MNTGLSSLQKVQGKHQTDTSRVVDKLVPGSRTGRMFLEEVSGSSATEKFAFSTSGETVSSKQSWETGKNILWSTFYGAFYLKGVLQCREPLVLINASKYCELP